VEWLDTLPYTITLPPSFDSAMVVHAGLLPGAALPEQTASNMSRMRNVEPAVRRLERRALVWGW
jgi:hypothetical protein